MKRESIMSKSNNKPNPFVTMGITLATVFFNTDKDATNGKRNAMLKAAELASDKDKAKAILESYALQLKEHGYKDTIIATRKNECNTVFKAFNATGISEVNQTALRSHTGHYNDFIVLARSLMPVVVKSSTTPAKPRKLELSDKQLEKSDELINRASAKQLADIVDQASININKIVAPKMAGHQALILINSIASNTLEHCELEEYEKGVFTKLVTESQTALNRLTKAMQDAQTATMNAASETAQHVVTEKQTAVETEK